MENENIDLTEMDVYWDCPNCGAHNMDNYYLSRSVLCESCFYWFNWQRIVPASELDSLYWTRLWYAEETGDGDTLEAMRESE